MCNVTNLEDMNSSKLARRKHELLTFAPRDEFVDLVIVSRQRYSYHDNTALLFSYHDNATVTIQHKFNTKFDIVRSLAT